MAPESCVGWVSAPLAVPQPRARGQAQLNSCVQHCPHARCSDPSAGWVISFCPSPARIQLRWVSFFYFFFHSRSTSFPSWRGNNFLCSQHCPILSFTECDFSSNNCHSHMHPKFILDLKSQDLTLLSVYFCVTSLTKQRLAGSLWLWCLQDLEPRLS